MSDLDKLRRPLDAPSTERSQGYRDGYARACADVVQELSRAIDVAYEGAGIADYVRALQHARAIVRGLASKARQR